MRVIILFYFIGLLAMIDLVQASGSPAWNRFFGEAPNEDGTSVAIGSDGIYLAGSVDGRDSFLAKYDTDGNQLWSKAFKDRVVTQMSMTTGGMYMSGYAIIATGLTVDAFISRVDLNGNLLWCKNMNPGHNGEIRAIAAGNDMVYAAGVVNEDPFSTYILALDGSGDVVWNHVGERSTWDFSMAVVVDGLLVVQSDLLVKYDAGGNQLWNCTINGIVTDIADTKGDIAVASDGIYITSSMSSLDAYLAKLDLAGNLLWSHTYNGLGEDSGRAVAVSSGFVYMAGDTWNGYSNCFLCKYDGDGKQLWNKTWGGVYNDYVKDICAIGTAIYVAGTTFSYGNSLLATSGNAYLLKVDASGVMDNFPLDLQAQLNILIASIAIGISIFIFITVIASKMKKRRLEAHRIDKIKTLLSTSHHVRIGELAAVIKMPRKDLVSKLIEWSSVISFKISGDEIVLAEGESDKFVAEIDNYFKDWTSKEKSKKEKI